MQTIKIEKEFFNICDTLECGQVFRFTPYKKGYKLISEDKCCYLYSDETYTYVQTDCLEYFKSYFDIEKDYSSIYSSVLNLKDEFISKVANLGKGIRILRQSKRETAYSFIISQNNNIPRIKRSIELLCESLGEKRFFDGEPYYAFPTDEVLASKDSDFFKSLGLGYRDKYLNRFSKMLYGGFDLDGLSNLTTDELCKKLMSFYGIGKKVADCISFFGYHKTDSFPVDTWIEKIYLENLGGEKKGRDKISKELIQKYGDLSGYIQQYLFYYKRTIEKSAN